MPIDNATADNLLPDALRDALGQVLAEERRQWRRERELIEAQALAAVAQLKATIVELLDVLRRKSMPGVAGPPGPPRPPGSPGKLPLAKTWEPGRVFYSGDVVVHGGATYQCLRETGRSVTHLEDWICLARAGRDGRDGLRMIYARHMLALISLLLMELLSLPSTMIPASAPAMAGS